MSNDAVIKYMIEDQATELRIVIRIHTFNYILQYQRNTTIINLEYINLKFFFKRIFTLYYDTLKDSQNIRGSCDVIRINSH